MCNHSDLPLGDEKLSAVENPVVLSFEDIGKIFYQNSRKKLEKKSKSSIFAEYYTANDALNFFDSKARQRGILNAINEKFIQHVSRNDVETHLFL